jgi:hypothetical protein
MVTKTLHLRETGKTLKLRSLILGSAMAIIAASAVAGTANADVIGIQTLGDDSGSEMPVGSVLARGLSNPMAQILGTTGDKGDGGEGDGGTGGEGPSLNLVNLQEPSQPTQELQEAATRVPEPSVLGLFGAGLVALGIARRRRRG